MNEQQINYWMNNCTNEWEAEKSKLFLEILSKAEPSLEVIQMQEKNPNLLVYTLPILNRWNLIKINLGDTKQYRSLR